MKKTGRRKEIKLASKEPNLKRSSTAGSGVRFFLFPFSFFLRKAWWWLRQVSGDAAYENYLAWRARHAGRPGLHGCAGSHACALPSAEEFYMDALRRRYTGVSRCC
jgi:hypothetical protein